MPVKLIIDPSIRFEASESEFDRGQRLSQLKKKLCKGVADGFIRIEEANEFLRRINILETETSKTTIEMFEEFLSNA